MKGAKKQLSIRIKTNVILGFSLVLFAISGPKTGYADWVSGPSLRYPFVYGKIVEVTNKYVAIRPGCDGNVLRVPWGKTGAFGYRIEPGRCRGIDGIYSVRGDTICALCDCCDIPDEGMCSGEYINQGYRIWHKENGVILLSAGLKLSLRNNEYTLSNNFYDQPTLQIPVFDVLQIVRSGFHLNCPNN